MPWANALRQGCGLGLRKDGACCFPCLCGHHRQACGMVRETRPPSSQVSCPRYPQPPYQVSSAANIAKGLKGHRMVVQVFFTAILSHLFFRTRGPSIEGYIPFSSFLYLLSSDHVERVCLFVLIYRESASILSKTCVYSVVRSILDRF